MSLLCENDDFAQLSVSFWFTLKGLHQIWCKKWWTFQLFCTIVCTNNGPEAWSCNFTTQPQSPPANPTDPPTKPLLRVNFGPISSRFWSFFRPFSANNGQNRLEIGFGRVGQWFCGWKSGHKLRGPFFTPDAAIFSRKLGWFSPKWATLNHVQRCPETNNQDRARYAEYILRIADRNRNLSI